MGYDVLKRKCGAHNRIIGNRETCPQCADAARKKVDWSGGHAERLGPEPGDDRDVQWDAGGGALKCPYEDKLIIHADGAVSWSKPAWQPELERIRHAADHVRRAEEDLKAWRANNRAQPANFEPNYSLADKMIKLIYSDGIDPAFK
jgi:hypothetical protein